MENDEKDKDTGAETKKEKDIQARHDLKIRIHKAARTTPYPKTKIQRAYVPDSRVHWNVRRAYQNS